MLSGSLALLTTIALTAATTPPYLQQKCSSLARYTPFSTHNATILNSTYYAATRLNVSGSLNNDPFCEVYASVPYGSNASLIFAMWLPDRSKYKDRFMAVGNGGMAGTIDYATMMTQLNSGLALAVAGGNAGHLASENNDGGGAPGIYLPYLHHKSQVTAWIHDAISLFTPAAKALATEYYDCAPRHSYYYGCSTGGAQGFALAEFHPTLFDGIYAGSPGNWHSHLALSFLWNAQRTNTISGNMIQAELNFTTNAVLEACDDLDGVQDRLIEDPLRCRFDIDSLQCTNLTSGAPSTESSCLEPGKVAAAKQIYAGPRRSDDGSQLYPGFSFGSEIEWISQEGDLADAFSIPLLQNLVFDNLQYDRYNFNWASDVAAVDKRAGTLIDEISADLLAFREYGGKLLTFQGWTDPFNAATWPIEHLAQIDGFSGGDVSDFYRLFMIPGGGPCGAAAYYPHVPATYHTVSALIKWVEKSQKPEAILSSNPPDGSNRTRKLCPWPATAHFCAGSIDDWTSYTCQ